jgi:hypothetical protein
MGTNFYLRSGEHVGKRSAAGMYCWECGVTLCKNGEEGIHYGCRQEGHSAFCDCHWHKECPVCGAKQKKEKLENSTGGRELGFNKNKPGKKNGVQSCCSFTWAIEKDKIKNRFVFKDEYGRSFSRDEFKKILEECPVQFYNLIGVEFF